MRYIILLLLTLIMLACTAPVKKPELGFLDKKVSVNKKIAWILKEENNSLLQIPEEAKVFLNAFYSQAHYKALWVNDSAVNEQGEALSTLLAQPIAFGVPDKRVFVRHGKKLHRIIREMELTASLGALFMDLRYGILDTSKRQNKPVRFPSVDEFQKIVRFTTHEPDSMAQQLIAWGPSDTTYQHLALGLFTWVRTRDLYPDKNLEVPLQKEDSLTAFELAKKALKLKGYLAAAEENNDSLLASLKRLQADHGLKPDGVIGSYTCEALNETLLEKAQRTALVMDKRRQHLKTDQRYIEVNIPEYLLRFYADDTLKSIHRIVVGKFDTQTPELQARLRTIIAYPYWSVPFSITSKEMLPDARRNPNYFSRNRMKLYRKNQEIDPLTVNWKKIPDKTFPYKVIQQPGPDNSLGIIKFDFYNKFGVYFHDTPQKRLFNNPIRSYSHGCMRCENPVDLAHVILLKDENPMLPDSLDSMLFKKQHRSITLKKQIPIYVEYRSVITSLDGELIFMPDIYKRDCQAAKLMFS